MNSCKKREMEVINGDWMQVDSKVDGIPKGTGCGLTLTSHYERVACIATYWPIAFHVCTITVFVNAEFIPLIRSLITNARR